MIYRTHNCGQLRKEDASKKVKLAGWLDSKRDKGGLLFAVLRDFYGVTQIVVAEEPCLSLLRDVPTESTVSVEGTVVLRSAPNEKLPTGLIEIVPEKVEVLGKRVTNALPFEISHSLEAGEDARLRYRFLDLRNPAVKDKIILRAQIISELRRLMTEQGFYEISTPILTSSSPEGARDYIVPSRIYPGEFYALPQAPQQYKQLLMCAGFDKYFQIAPCFRDEDARADRSPGEFYQLDIEMAFASQDDVFAVLESVLPPVFAKFSGKTADKPPFRRIPYREALENYGSDKPDLRNPLLVKDISHLLDGCGFAPVEGKTVKAIAVNNFSQTRKWIDKLVEDFKIKTEGGAAYWFRLDENGAPVGGISKFLSEKLGALRDALGLQNNSFVALVAEDKLSLAQKRAGVLRTMLGTGLDLLEKDVFRFCWIVDFPMYEIGEESGALEFCHNPFSMPQGGMSAFEKDPLDILAYQYDIVCNGIELSSGAVRNHDPEIMLKAFSLVGLDKSVVESKFPALYHAFEYGAPPHAGVAPGVDRMVMLICDTVNIREVIAFPMNKNARDLMMNAPAPVEQKQLDEVHIALDLKKRGEK
ncbi:MAG: aspartate--tRNA ligase [Clostridia bacterium]|jgi:aspartyl-tRNA synthetase|nr:aspartate--tRNA ligase [Clostridia bacterium]